MAFTARYNITSSNPTDLIAAGENAGNLRSILLTNVHSSNSISVDLSLYNASDYKTIIAEVVRTDANNVTINTNDDPSTIASNDVIVLITKID